MLLNLKKVASIINLLKMGKRAADYSRSLQPPVSCSSPWAHWQVHISKRGQSVQSESSEFTKTKLDGSFIGLDFMSPGEGQAARGEMTNHGFILGGRGKKK